MMDEISKYLLKIQQTIKEQKINLAEYEVYYRGESNKYEGTIPSIFRGNYLKNEHIMFRELELRYPNIFDDVKTTVDKLSIMQHYGLPTRLLDFTTNPLLALYMSIDKNLDTKNALKKFNPTIKIVFIKKENIKYYDSDTVSIFANFSKIKNELVINLNGYCLDDGKLDYKEGSPRIGKKDFFYLKWSNLLMLPRGCKYELGEKLCKDGNLQYLLHEIKGEKPYFKNMIWTEHLNKNVIFIKPKHNSQRIINQAGLFALFGLKEAKKESFSLEDCQKTNNFKISSFELLEIVGGKRTKKKTAKNIKKVLSILGVSYDKVYPEIEHASKYINTLYR